MALNTLAIWLTKRGKQAIASQIVVIQLLAIGLGLISFWGHDLPIGLLMLILSVVLAGILFGNQAFLITSIFIVSSYSLIGWFQVSRASTLSQIWKSQPFSYADIVIYATTMAVIFAVTWLFNRQLHSAYLRAKASEAALQEQSDHLEELVEERTEELQQEYFQRMTDLHRFVLFGKEAGSLLHDLLSPLTSLGIDMENLGRKQRSSELTRAQETLAQLEALVAGARRNIRRETKPETFPIAQEIDHVWTSLQARATRSHIALISSGATGATIHADPIVLYKILQNLVTNSVEACEKVVRRQHRITIAVKHAKQLIITISDTGCGIPAQQLPHIFDANYSTALDREGAGLGLSLVKELVELELNGTVTVSSSPRGTKVTLTLPVAS